MVAVIVSRVSSLVTGIQLFRSAFQNFTGSGREGRQRAFGKGYTGASVRPARRIVF